MVVFSVLVDETTQMPLAERDHACETLLVDRPDEPLGRGVEIGTLRRQPNRLNTGALQDLAKDPRIEGIAVVNQMARPAQTAIDRVGHIAGLLLHPRAARLRVDPGDGHAAGSQLDHEEDEVPPEPRQRPHLDGEQIAGRQALPVRLQERLPGHVPAPLGRRVDSVVVQDPLHRGPGDRVAEVRERAADPRVAPPRIVDRHPDHELGDVLSGHWSTSTAAGAAIVCLGDQSPVPTQDRIRGDDARDLRQDPPAEFMTAHSESTTLGVRQAKRPRAQVFSEDPILLPEIVDQIVLVTVHPASEREDEELQRRRHSLRLLGRLDQHRPGLGHFFAPYGIRLRDHAFVVDSGGYQALITWAETHGRIDAFGIEGTGSYGAGLARAVRRAGHRVVEVNRGDRRTRRAAGKSDTLDAEVAARSVMAGQSTAIPKTADGAVEMMRQLKITRDTAVKARTTAMNTLKQIVVHAPPELREALHALTDHGLLTRCAGLRPGPLDTLTASAKHTLRALARRWMALTEEMAIHDQHLARLTTETSPTLREGFGVGAHTAAELLIVFGDNPDRIRSDAAFAKLCGACPLPASSGMTTGRHRLNRGGHRQANAALYRAIIVRMRYHQPTVDDVARRTADGRTKREIIRCLKRFLAREIYQRVMTDFRARQELIQAA